MREGYSSGNLCNVQPVHPTPRLYLTLVDTIIELTKKPAEAPCNARQGEAGEEGFRIRICTPFSHLVLRQAVAAVSPKPGSRMGF